MGDACGFTIISVALSIEVMVGLPISRLEDMRAKFDVLVFL